MAMTILKDKENFKTYCKTIVISINVDQTKRSMEKGRVEKQNHMYRFWWMSERHFRLVGKRRWS